MLTDNATMSPIGGRGVGSGSIWGRGAINASKGLVKAGREVEAWQLGISKSDDIEKMQTHWAQCG
jgi:hypothetical protein